jgi:folate-binding protein YgfZ
METLLFDQSDRAKIEMRGADRASFLNNFCTNDIVKLPVGGGCEAFLTTGQAKILARMLVFALPEALWIDADPGLAPKVMQHLERYVITEQVELFDRSGALAEWHLSGAGANIGRQWPDLAPLQILEQAITGIGCQIRRNDALGQLGYDILCPREQKAAMEEYLAPKFAVAGSPRDYEFMRIRAGLPIYGRDMDEANLPQEVGRDALAISFTKGCYLGQETVARIHALGHVNRLLVGLHFDGSGAVPPGSPVFHQGQEIGKVTSAAEAPHGEGWYALAYVRRGHTAPATPIEVVSPHGRLAGTVAGLPVS